MSQYQYLFESLDHRYRPEDVADSVMQLLNDDLRGSERRILQRAAKRSIRQSAVKYTSMLQDFLRPKGFQNQIETATDIFEIDVEMTEDDYQNPQKVEDFIRQLNQQIAKRFGGNDYLQDRLNREARHAAGLDLSRRRYNKLFRHVARMENKLQTYLHELKKLELTKIGKSGLAHKLDYSEFVADKDTACFIAYFTARNNLRSEFTIYGQQRAYDEIADMLFSRCKHSETTNWWAIAHVYPHDTVLSHLSDEQKGSLLGRWFSILEEISSILDDVWKKSNINRETMIVRRGNDSSTWNNMANAWNKARDNWIALVYALGLDDMLQSICFGKVLRLMAADVAAWHRSAGGGLDPNTFVWRELPLPWEVIDGNRVCTMQMVIDACEKHGLNPEKSGWIAPRPRNKIEKYRPTPELVHGVTVSSPYLAKVLRSSGFFSGKISKHETTLNDFITHQNVLHDHHERLKKQEDDKA